MAGEDRNLNAACCVCSQRNAETSTFGGRSMQWAKRQRNSAHWRVKDDVLHRVGGGFCPRFRTGPRPCPPLADAFFVAGAFLPLARLLRGRSLAFNVAPIASAYLPRLGLSSKSRSSTPRSGFLMAAFLAAPPDFGADFAFLPAPPALGGGFLVVGLLAMATSPVSMD